MMGDIQDKIDNYLLGRMSNAEAEEFDQEMASDDVVRGQFLFTQMVRDQLRDREGKSRSMERWRKQMEEDRKPRRLRRILWYSIGGAGAAAMIVLGVSLFHPFQPMMDTTIYAQAIDEETDQSNEEANPLRSLSNENQAKVIALAVSNVSQSQAIAYAYSSDDTTHKYLREVKYYQKQVEHYRREAEYYRKQAEGYEREQEYHLKQAEKYQRDAAYYSKRGDFDKAKTQTRYAQNEMDKAELQANYAKKAWDKYWMQMKCVKNAKEKAAVN